MAESGSARKIFQKVSSSPTKPPAEKKDAKFDVADLYQGPANSGESQSESAGLDEKLRQAYFWIVNNAIISPFYDIEYNDDPPTTYQIGDRKTTLTLPTGQSYSSFVLMPLLNLAVRRRCLFVGGPGRGKTASAILMGVLAGYSLDWATNKKMSSLTALLGMLRDLTKKKPYSNRRELLQYLASLEDAKGNVRQALALYRRLLSGKKQQRKVILWRMVYLLERAGDVRRRHAVLLRLSRQHKDGVADQLLAKSYRDRLQIRQAIVHYRLYIKRKKSQYPMRYYQRYGLGRAYKALEMAKFLMPSQDSARIEFFLRQALSGVRLVNQSGRSSYRYRAMVKEMMRLLSQSGRLSRFIASWQKRLKATPDQLHLLSLLRFAYEVKGDHDKYQAILVHILQRRPDEHSLLSALLFSYETYGKYKEAIALLNKLYKHSTNKPKDMALRLGDFYVHLGRKKMALAYWKKHFAGCLKLFSQYPKFRCGFTVGDRVVLAGMTQQALHMYTSTLKASSYRSDYQIRRALRFLIAKKDFAAALKVFERPQRSTLGAGRSIVRYGFARFSSGSRETRGPFGSFAAGAAAFGAGCLACLGTKAAAVRRGAAAGTTAGAAAASSAARAAATDRGTARVRCGSGSAGAAATDRGTVRF